MQIIVRFARFVRKKKYCFCFCWAWYYFRILDVQKPKLGFLPCYFTKNYHVFHGYTKHLYLTFQTSDLYLNRFLQKQTAVFLLAKKSRLKGSRPQPVNLHKLLGRTKFSSKFINRSNFHSIESPAKYIPRSQLKAILWGKLWAPKMAEFRVLFWSPRGVWMQLVLEQFSAIVNNVQHLSRHVGPKNTQRPELRNTGFSASKMDPECICVKRFFMFCPSWLLKRNLFFMCFSVAKFYPLHARMTCIYP